MRTIERDIVGAFIFSGDGYFLAGKSKPGGVYADLWLIPGGGIEPGESTHQAMLREVQEETGLVIPEEATITALEDTALGESEKVVDGERVLVKMVFNDFVVEIPRPAAELAIAAGDDFAHVQWVPVGELTDMPMGGVMRQRLNSLGYL